MLAILLPALFGRRLCPLRRRAGADGRLRLGMGAAQRLWGAGALALGRHVCVQCVRRRGGLGWVNEPLTVWWLAAALWVLGGAWLLHQRRCAGLAAHSGAPCGWWLGVLALWLAWLAVVQARMVGVNFLLSVLALVWAADIAAYFAGRAFGLRFTRNKLAPSISPGKSWEGVWGGVAACCCWRGWGWRCDAAGAPAGRACIPTCWQPRLVVCWCWRAVHGGHERGGRSG
jgi:phosphatidate cytidylyltransferase